MDSGARFLVRIITYIVVFALVALIVVVVKANKRRRTRNVLSVISQAIGFGRYPQALEVIREFLCIPTTIKGINKKTMDSIADTLASQMQATSQLPIVYRAADIDSANSTIQSINEILARQQTIANNGAIYSGLGVVRKEFADSFDALQADKDRLARSLPQLA